MGRRVRLALAMAVVLARVDRSYAVHYTDGA